MILNYDEGVKLALFLKYEEVIDEQAYCGRYYIKNGEKWIHNIILLKNHLNISDNQDLRKLGYAVDDYYKCKGCATLEEAKREMLKREAKEEMMSIYSGITHEDGEPTYMCDGMWLYPDGSMRER